MFAAQAIVAADEALVTVLPGFHELRAHHRVLDDLDAHSEQVSTDLGLLGVLLLNAAASTVTREYREFLRGEDLGVFPTVIPLLRLAVAAERAASTSWQEIGERLGVSRRLTPRRELGVTRRPRRGATRRGPGVAPSFARNPTLSVCRHSARTLVGR